MKKSILPLLGVAVCGNLLVGNCASAMSATRVEEQYAVRWETDQPFLVTEIRPADGQLVMVYTDLNKSGRRVTNANIVWEKKQGVGGDTVSQLGDSNPDWAVTAYNRKIAGTALFVSKYEQTFAKPTTDLTENTAGVLYYYITVAKSAEYSLYGKVDYSMCLNSPLYREGAYCRLEVDEDGEPGYYPYQDGEKIEEEEPEEDEDPEEEPGDEPGETEDPESDPEEEPGETEETGSEDIEPEGATEKTETKTEVEKNEVATTSGPTDDFVAYDLSGGNSDKNIAETSDTQDVAEVLPLGETEPQDDKTWYNELMKGLEVLVIFACGFVLAQAIKTISSLLKGDKMPRGLGAKIGYLFRSGGMPSGHAASFVGATTFIGLSEGFSSVIFALAACMSMIVIYDAINVRYAVGEQGRLLMKIAKKEDLVDKKMRLVEGHTVPQVVVGSLLGIMIAMVFWFIF